VGRALNKNWVELMARFPRPGRSDRCRFGEETFAGGSGNGSNAPEPAIRALHRNRLTHYAGATAALSIRRSSVFHPAPRWKGRVASNRFKPLRAEAGADLPLARSAR
jgi:hypothetical protein